MQVIPTPINDLVVIEPSVHGDDRGWFIESYNQAHFAEQGIDVQFVQDNHSYSQAGVLRGLHFQKPPFTQGKLVRCTKGRLWDVAVDLRKDSPTFKQWFGLELSAENKKQLYVPEGFAHGFLALTDCEMQYKCTNYYSPSHDVGMLWNDPEVAVEWPLTADPVLSDKDSQLSPLSALSLPF